MAQENAAPDDVEHETGEGDDEEDAAAAQAASVQVRPAALRVRALMCARARVCVSACVFVCVRV